MSEARATESSPKEHAPPPQHSPAQDERLHSATETRKDEAGYVRTDLGVLPVDWRTSTLRDAAERISVGLATSVTEHYRSSGTPIVRNLNIKDGYFDGSEMLYVSDLFAQANSSKAARASDVLTVRTGSNLGLTCVLPPELDNCQTFTTLITTPKKAVLDSHFLCLQMGSHIGRAELDRLQVGGGKGNLNTGHLKHYRLVAPPLEEQRGIAETIRDVDALLGALERLIVKKRDLKQGTMQELLTGQTRLAGFRGKWKPQQLGSLGSTFGGLTGKGKADFGEGPARYITFTNVIDNVVVDCTRFDAVRVSPVESQNHVMRGDLLFNGSSETPDELALCAVLMHEAKELYLNSFCFGFRLRSDNEAHGLYLAYYFRGTPGRELMKAIAQGSTRYNLSKVVFLKAILTLPPFEEQVAIAEALAEMDAALRTLEQRRDKTRALKQGMMQELLTGRIRLV